MKKSKLLLTALISTGVLLTAPANINAEHANDYDKPDGYGKDGNKLFVHFAQKGGKLYMVNDTFSYDYFKYYSEIKGIMFTPLEMPEGLVLNSNGTITGAYKNYGLQTIRIKLSAPGYVDDISTHHEFVFPENYGLPKGYFKNLYLKVDKDNINYNFSNEFTKDFNWEISGLPEGVEFDENNLSLTGTPKELGTHIVDIVGRYNKKIKINDYYFSVPNIRKQFTITVVEDTDPIIKEIIKEKIVYVDNAGKIHVVKQNGDILTIDNPSKKSSGRVLPKTNAVN